MLSIAVVLLGACIALLIWLGLRLRETRKQISSLQQETLALAAAANALPADLPSVLGERRGPLLVLEILNPQQLAAQQSWLGDAFGGLAPELVRKLVYRKALPMVKKEMAKHGVEAQVEIYRGG